MQVVLQELFLVQACFKGSTTSYYEFIFEGSYAKLKNEVNIVFLFVAINFATEKFILFLSILLFTKIEHFR
jgi:hypothetical protein